MTFTSSGFSILQTKVVAQLRNNPITKQDLMTLQPGTWLNDRIVNFWCAYVSKCAMEGKGSRASTIAVHSFNSFFYVKLQRAGYSGVKRWTKSIRVFSLDVILVPIHLPAHWTLAVIRPKARRLEYLDSLGGRNARCLQLLEAYLRELAQDEGQDAGQDAAAQGKWEHVQHGAGVPQQHNGYDCGVFVCKVNEERWS